MTDAFRTKKISNFIQEDSQREVILNLTIHVSADKRIRAVDVKGQMQRNWAYNQRQKSWHACTLFQHLSRQFIRSPLSPQFNVVYRDEGCHCSFQTLSGGGGGRGFLIPLMPLVIVSKIAYQRMFQLSDPGVPRTFVEDCIFVTRRDYDMFSGKIRKRAPCFVCFCDGIDFGGTANVLGSSISLLIMILYILRKHVKVH